MIRIAFDKDRSVLRTLKAGQEIRLNGTVYTARDAAHKKITELLSRGKRIPFDLKGAVIYYTGPTPAPPGMVIGACGPTTSGRMDPFTPVLLKEGLIAAIGKGSRSEEVRRAFMRYRGVYLIAPAGCGALLSAHVTKAECLAFRELGPEAVYLLTLKDFPVTVGIDSRGHAIKRTKRIR